MSYNRTIWDNDLLIFRTLKVTVIPRPIPHGRLLVAQWVSPHTGANRLLLVSHWKRSSISGNTPGMVL
jgi:hypothetical protein